MNLSRVHRIFNSLVYLLKNATESSINLSPNSLDPDQARQDKNNKKSFIITQHAERVESCFENVIQNIGFWGEIRISYM